MYTLRVYNLCRFDVHIKYHFANTKNVFARKNNQDVMFDKVFGVRTVFAKQRKRSYIFDVTP